MRFAVSFARWRTAVLAAVERFPFVLLCGAIGSGCAITAIHSSNDQALIGNCSRLAMTIALGLPLFFSLRLQREREPRLTRMPIEWLGVLLLAGWFFTQPARPFDAPGIVVVCWLLLLAGLHFFTAVSAYLRGGESLGFWQFNRHLFLRFCLATLYSAVLTVGFELALLSADKLFELHLDKAYGDLFFLMAGCFHPAFFLSGVTDDFAALQSATDYPRGLKAFTQFALAPLVAVYTAILFAYAGKILVTRSWPHGWVALPVLILAGVGIFATLLLHPLRENSEEKWAHWYGRSFPRALAPLAILLLLSLRVRIADYGVTEERYLGVVAGLWILSWALVFIVRSRAGIRWVPSSLAVICFLIAFGPWSAGAVSKMSQLHRVTALLRAHGLWSEGHARPAAQPVDLSTREREQLRSSLAYLFRMHGGKVIRPIFAPMLDTTKLTSWQGPGAILEALHIRAEKDSNSVSLHRTRKDPLPLAGYRQLWQLDLADGRESAWRPHELGNVSIGLDKGVLKFRASGDSSPQPLPFPPVIASFPSGQGDHSIPAFTIDFARGDRSYRIVFDEVTFFQTSNGPRFGGCSFFLLEK